MKKALKKIENKTWYYKDGASVYGVHDKITGDASGISGDASGIWGNVSGITGDVSGITGYVSGIRGDVSGIRGDVDVCELTDEDRKNGLDIRDLLEK